MLGASNRPEKLNAWVKASRPYAKAPDVTDCVEEFGSEWLIWWRCLQPDWRVEDNDPPNIIGLTDDMPAKYEGRDWTTLSKPGPNGIFLVLLGLSWWGQGLQTCEDAHQIGRWHAGVSDMYWIFEHMHRDVTRASLPDSGDIDVVSAGIKRTGDHGDTNTTKRYMPQFSHWAIRLIDVSRQRSR